MRKDLTEWLHQPRTIVVTFLPSVLFILIVSFSTAAVGRNKVALVVEDNGSHAQALAANIKDYDAFITTETTADEAKRELDNLQIEAIITIPAGFESAYTAHQPDPVTITINNLNLDFTNDLRRSLPAAITTFYGDLNNSPINIKVNETDLRTHDIDFLQFQILPLLVQLLTVAGVINTGLATAREWEEQTVKELYLAPVSRGSIITGKILAGWIITMAFGAMSMILAGVTGFFQPPGLTYWLLSAVIIALISLMSVGLGVALAALLRREQRVIGLGITLTFYLFFLSGGFTVAAFLPTWVRTIAQFIPTFYGVHALEMAVFYGSTDLLGRDVLVLVGTSILAVGVGVIALRRRMFA
jgi:ABC-type multidrug transport system permease subunit